MKPEKQHQQNDHARAGTERSGTSRRQAPGPLFDLPPVEPSQMTVYLKLMKGFHADGTRPDKLDEMAVCRVMNGAYEPRRGFWQTLEVMTVLEAIACYAPDLRVTRERTAPGGYVAFVWQIDRTVLLLRFLERCAERLLDMPTEIRPKCEAATWQWLYDDCGQRGETRGQSLLEDVGERCIVFVLRMMRLIERAPAMSSERQQADRCRRRRAKQHIS